MVREITNTQDVIDSRDVIARIEELEDERQSLVDEIEEAEEALGAIDCDNEEEAYAGAEETLEDAKEALKDWDASDEAAELKTLKTLAEDGEDSTDWSYGETLIHEDYFTKYIEELIDDCYEMPKEMKSGDWPWRHVVIDYEAAAEEAKQDYFTVDFDGATYWIRA